MLIYPFTVKNNIFAPGSLSASNVYSANVVYATGGNSNLWNSTYSTVSSLSANYILAGGNSKGADIIIGTNDNYALKLETAGTTKMTVTSAGSVGIGTTLPATPLHIVSGVNSNLYLGTTASNDGIHEIRFGFIPAPTNSYAASIVGIRTGGGGRGNLEFRVAGGGDATNAIQSDTAIRITSADVQVLKPLTYAQDVLAIGDNYNSGVKAFKFTRNENKAAIWSVPSGSFGKGDIRFTTGDDNTATAKTESDATVIIARKGGLILGNSYISTQPTGGTLLVSDTVGIGTTSPVAKLDIADTTYAGSSALSGSALNITQTWSTSGSPTAIKLNVTNTNSGAASNLLDLQVGGVSKLSVAKSGNIFVNSITADGGSGGNAIGFDINGSNWGFSNGGNSSFRFGTLHSAYLYVTSTKQWKFAGTSTIGWTPGTPDGAADLLLARDAANTLAQRNGINPQAFRLYNTYTDAVSAFERLNIKWDTDVLKLGTERGSVGGLPRALELQTDGTTRMTITSAGRVGIGTTTAAATLQIIHDSSTAPLDIRRTGFLGSQLFTINNLGDITGGAAVFTPKLGHMVTALTVTGNGTFPAAIFQTGNVGIGTTTPNANLTVVGVISSTNIVYASGGNSDLWNSAYASVNSISANGATTYTTVNTNSANWSNVYTSYSTNSANFVDYLANSSTQGRIEYSTPSAGLLTVDLANLGTGGSPQFTNLTLTGNLSVLGDLTYLNTNVSVTSALSVVNAGTGPALYIKQSGTEPIAYFDGVEGGVSSTILFADNGFVGLGTSTPNNRLAVVGVISSTNIVYASGGNSDLWNSTYTSVNANSANGASVYTTVNANSANWNSTYTTVNTNSANYILDGGNLKGSNITIGTKDNFNLNLETADTTRVTVTSAGNVGIGTSNPGYLLDLNGSSRITNNLFFGTSSLASMGMVGNNLTINSYAGNPVKIDSLQVTSFQYGVTFQYGDLTLNKSAGVDTYIRSTNQDLRLQSGSTYNLLLNSTAGNVGIGTITPNEKLTVAGVISSSNVVYALGGNSNLWNSAYATVNSISANGATTYTTVNTNSASWSSVYTTVCAASANNILDGGNTKGANISIGTNDNFNLNLETANATRMTVTSAGNVGIGNTAPSAILDVRNAYGLPNSSNGTIRILSTDAAGTAGVGATLSLGGNAATASRNAVTLLGANQSTSGDRGYLGIFTNGTGISTAYGERLRIDSDGSTIINPVNNNTVGTKGLIIRASSGQTANLTEWQNSSNVGIGAVSSDGNFGIGIVAPTSKLHIVGNVTIGTGVLDLDAGYSIRWGGSASGIYSGSGTSDMVVTVGSAERLRINGSSGNVGIGVTSPGAKLTVSGTISSNNIIYAVGGNSDIWNSTYTSVNANSANGASVYTTTNTNSANWSNAYTNVNANSANWNTTYNTVNTNSSNWTFAYNQVNSGYLNWNSTYTNVNANSSNWSNAYTTVNSISANGSNTYTTVNANSANWSNVYTTVNTNSANYILAGGNSKGADITIGTNDNFGLNLETNGTTRMSISANGLVTIDSIPISRGIGTNTTNIAIGRGLTYNTAGINNTSVGTDALSANLGGANNTAIGYNSLKSNRTGAENIAIGASALTNNTIASFNTAVGMGALNSNTTGGSNTAIGSLALGFLNSGTENIAIGRTAGLYTESFDDLTTCSSSIFIGTLTTPTADGEINQIVIGHSAAGAGSNSTTLNNTSTTLTRIRGTNAHVLDVTGNLTVSNTISSTGVMYASGGNSNLWNQNTSALYQATSGQFAVKNANNFFSASQSLTGDVTVRGTVYIDKGDGNPLQEVSTKNFSIAMAIALS